MEDGPTTFNAFPWSEVPMQFQIGSRVRAGIYLGKVTGIDAACEVLYVELEHSGTVLAFPMAQCQLV